MYEWTMKIYTFIYLYELTLMKIYPIFFDKIYRHEWTMKIYTTFFKNIQWQAKVLNTLQIVKFFKYYKIDDSQTWSEYWNITGFFTDIRLMNKKYFFFIISEIFKITLRKSFGHIQFFIDFFVISLWYCIQAALIMFHDGMQLLSQAKLTA